MQDWLMARAYATPHKIALYWYDDTTRHSMTFAELAQAVTREAQRLQIAGIRHGHHVAIASYNLHQDVVGLFALIRLGCVLVPVNTRLTQDEITFQCQQADTRAIICYEASKAPLYAGIPNCPLIAPDMPDMITPDDALPGHPIDLDLPLAIIHTSGTSGKPKGAILTYNNFYQSALASAYHSGVRPDDHWLCVLPLFHVGGLSIILRSVLYGTTVTLLPRFDARTVNDILTTYPITLVSLVPTMLYRLLQIREQAWHEALRLVLLGGAAPSLELVQACVAQGIPVVTTYGLSEATSQVATSTLEGVIAKPASVGKPLLFTQVSIVGADGTPLPAHEIGEVVVTSPTVMQGYYRNMEANARTLRNGRLYTGDMGYLDDEGDLWIVQRRSDLIVTGGENVYPAEIEAVLRQHPRIEDACVVGIDDTEWGQQVVVAIILRGHQPIDTTDIDTFLRYHLAGYKIPRQMKFLDTFPLTASGKINRHAIKELF